MVFVMKKRAYAAVIILFLCGSAFSQEKGAVAVWRNVEACYNLKRYHDAGELCHQLMTKKGPTFSLSILHYTLGNISLLQGCYDEACRCYENIDAYLSPPEDFVKAWYINNTVALLKRCSQAPSLSERERSLSKAQDVMRRLTAMEEQKVLEGLEKKCAIISAGMRYERYVLRKNIASYDAAIKVKGERIYGLCGAMVPTVPELVHIKWQIHDMLRRMESKSTFHEKKKVFELLQRASQSITYALYAYRKDDGDAFSLFSEDVFSRTKKISALWEEEEAGPYDILEDGIFEGERLIAMSGVASSCEEEMQKKIKSVVRSRQAALIKDTRAFRGKYNYEENEATKKEVLRLVSRGIKENEEIFSSMVEHFEWKKALPMQKHVVVLWKKALSMMKKEKKDDAEQGGGNTKMSSTSKQTVKTPPADEKEGMFMHRLYEMLSDDISISHREKTDNNEVIRPW
jgi:tetratricopeptide (TPR) repeat protein